MEEIKQPTKINAFTEAESWGLAAYAEAMAKGVDKRVRLTGRLRFNQGRMKGTHVLQNYMGKMRELTGDATVRNGHWAEFEERLAMLIAQVECTHAAVGIIAVKYFEALGGSEHLAANQLEAEVAAHEWMVRELGIDFSEYIEEAARERPTTAPIEH